MSRPNESQPLGIRFERASKAVDRMPTLSSVAEENKILVDLAQVEATRLLAESQRLLAEAMREANALKRIELGLSSPDSGPSLEAEGRIQDSMFDPMHPPADLSGHRPEDYISPSGRKDRSGS
jgi:hypothetical protein